MSVTEDPKVEGIDTFSIPEDVHTGNFDNGDILSFAIHRSAMKKKNMIQSNENSPSMGTRDILDVAVQRVLDRERRRDSISSSRKFSELAKPLFSNDTEQFDPNKLNYVSETNEFSFNEGSQFDFSNQTVIEVEKSASSCKTVAKLQIIQAIQDELCQLLSSASIDKLRSLHGIGKIRAEKILNLRKERSCIRLEDLDQIGMSVKMIERLYRENIEKVIECLDSS